MDTSHCTAHRFGEANDDVKRQKGKRAERRNGGTEIKFNNVMMGLIF